MEDDTLGGIELGLAKIIVQVLRNPFASFQASHESLSTSPLDQLPPDVNAPLQSLTACRQSSTTISDISLCCWGFSAIFL